MARKRKDPDRIKRPSNCFILFRRDLGNRKKTEKFSLSQGEVSKTAGQQWREASKEVKEYYTQLALEEKRLHEIQFPGYTFQPQRKTDVQKQDGHLALMSSTPSPSPASSSSSASQPSPSASPEETPQQTMAGPTMYTPTRHFRVDPSPFNASTVGQGMYIPSISIPVTTFDEVESDSDYTVRLHGPFGCSPTMSAATYSPLPEHVARGYSSSVSPLSSPTHPDDAEAPIEFAASFTYTHTETMLHQPQPQSFEAEPQYEVVENVPFTWANPDSTWLAPQHQNNIQSDMLVADIPIHQESDVDFAYPQGFLDGTANFDANHPYNVDEIPSAPSALTYSNTEALHNSNLAFQPTIFELHRESHQTYQYPGPSQQQPHSEQEHLSQDYYWDQTYTFGQGHYSGDISPVSPSGYVTQPQTPPPSSDEENGALHYFAYGQRQYTAGLATSDLPANYIAARTGHRPLQSMVPM